MMAAQTAAVLHSEAKIRVKPLGGFIGAEILGVDLRKPLNHEQFKAIHDAFVNYEVVVLRGSREIARQAVTLAAGDTRTIAIAP